MRMVLRRKCQLFVRCGISCEWMFATEFASDCECDGVVHSDSNHYLEFIVCRPLANVVKHGWGFARAQQKWMPKTSELSEPSPSRMKVACNLSILFKIITRINLLFSNSLRAKGTLISEPLFSTPCEMRFFVREKGKTAFSKKSPQQRPFSLSRVGKIASRRG